MENDGDNQNSLNIKDEAVENSSKVAHDPGWNDPPKVYGAMGQTKFIKKGLLNKRVPFPLNSNSPTTPSTSSLSATPPKGDIHLPFSSGDSPVDTSKSSSHSPFINPVSIPTCVPLSPKNDVLETLLGSSKPASEPKKDNEKTPDESSLEALMNVLEEVISELLTPENCDRIEGDIRKRLEVMKMMWCGGKLSGAVQEKMMQLAKALQKGQGSMANDLHIEMIVDHTSQVSAWMPGIRKLVHCCMLAADKVSKVEDSQMELAAEKNEEPHSQQTSEVDKTSG